MGNCIQCKGFNEYQESDFTCKKCMLHVQVFGYGSEPVEQGAPQAKDDSVDPIIKYSGGWWDGSAWVQSLGGKAWNELQVQAKSVWLNSGLGTIVEELTKRGPIARYRASLSGSTNGPVVDVYTSTLGEGLCKAAGIMPIRATYKVDTGDINHLVRLVNDLLDWPQTRGKDIDKIVKSSRKFLGVQCRVPKCLLYGATAESHWMHGKSTNFSEYERAMYLTHSFEGGSSPSVLEIAMTLKVSENVLLRLGLSEEYSDPSRIM